jgi:hypothetical protein
LKPFARSCQNLLSFLAQGTGPNVLEKNRIIDIMRGEGEPYFCWLFCPRNEHMTEVGSKNTERK